MRRIDSIKHGLIVAIALLASGTAFADTVVLKDGRVVQGLFKGGNEATVIVEAEGVVQTFAVTDVVSVTFNSSRVASASTAPKATPAAATAPGVLPAGTRLMIKLDKDVSSATHKTGSRLTGVLENDLSAGGSVIVLKGAKLYGKVVNSRGGKRIGKSYLIVTFTDLEINDLLVPIITDETGAEGEGGKILRKAAAGALIGGGIDGGKGAGKGAMIGAGVGLLGPGNHIRIPAGSIAEVTLKQPLTINK